MKLLLVRHSQTDWNREPARCMGWAEVELNETGRAQAHDLGRALKDSGVELVVTSHLVRARETAEILHEELGGELPFVVDPRLPADVKVLTLAYTFFESMTTSAVTPGARRLPSS